MHNDTTLSHFTQIVDSFNSPSSPEPAEGLLQILALLVALLAVFVGPFVQLVIAKRQINSTVLSANRQNWINELRNNISEFISLLLIVTDFQKRNIKEGLAERAERLNFVLYKIRLALNPTEEDHKKLDTALGDLLMSRDLSKLPDIEFLSQTILKKEWKRVKTLK